jgi:hypothetical protein
LLITILTHFFNVFIYFPSLHVSSNPVLIIRRIELYQHVIWYRQWRNGGGGGVQTPPKFRSFDKAEPNSQFRGKYIRNNLTRIWLSLIFLVVSRKALPTSYDPHSGIFFLSKTWSDVSIKYQKLRKFYHMKWNFLYQITVASRTPD